MSLTFTLPCLFIHATFHSLLLFIIIAHQSYPPIHYLSALKVSSSKAATSCDPTFSNHSLPPIYTKVCSSSLNNFVQTLHIPLYSAYYLCIAMLMYLCLFYHDLINHLIVRDPTYLLLWKLYRYWFCRLYCTYKETSNCSLLVHIPEIFVYTVHIRVHTLTSYFA